MHAGLAKFVVDDEAPDERVFAKDIPPLFKMNPRLHVEDTVFDGEGKIWHFLEKNILTDGVMPNGVWEAVPGKIAISTLLAGLWPPELK